MVVGLIALGCDRSASPQQAEPAVFAGELPIRVTSTCGMVTDIVGIVGGDRVEVTGLMGEGVDPHLYKPTRSDVAQLQQADIVFYSGLMLEGRMSDTLVQLGRKGKPVYAVTEEIDESFLTEIEGHWDPHVWMDVSAWGQCVEFVAESLSRFDPPGAEQYRRRAKEYGAQLRELDDYVHRVIGSIPPEQRYLITAHDAFNYFSRAYDIPVRSIQGISTESEAGVDDVVQLVDFIVKNRVHAIFVETSVPVKNVQAVVEGAARKGWQVEIGGELFSDAMGAGGTYEGTYIGMLDHNATLIARHLGGDAPAGGFQGKLSGVE
ncbi:MAG: zinc ABC transporter substrate-binding protein [Planctomycetales bacterium]|nr:zinc ABC transporter substrate-binding protein [Planctomycetales bacterium]